MITNPITAGNGSPSAAVGTASVIVDSIITGTNGDDSLFVYRMRVPMFNPSTYYGRVLMYGNGGNDRMIGSHGNDVLSGGSGNDVLTGGYGNDIIEGNVGNDTVDYSSRLSGGQVGYPSNNSDIWHYGFGVEVNLASGVGQTREPNSDEFDTLESIENAIGTNWADVLQGSEEANKFEGRDGNDYLFGWGGADSLKGGDGDDIISGGTGDDVLEGGLGNDFLQGNEGNDFASYGYSTVAVYVDLVNGFGAAFGISDYDTFANVESARGSSFGDTLLGNAQDNHLFGYSGNDSLFGASGADWLDGGEGNDYLIGGAGADLLDGGADIDTVDYSQSLSRVQVDLANESGTGGDAAGDILFDIENILGTSFSDSISGSFEDNEFFGFAGSDSLSGLEGQDLLNGGAGADRLDGGADTDWASYENSVVGVSVNLATGVGAGGDAAGDTLISIENVRGSQANDTLRAGATGSWLVGNGGVDTLLGGIAADGCYGGLGNDRISGSGGADRLVGEEGSDTINGGTGNDLIEGSIGADILTGGSGADSFYYLLASDSSTAFGRDTITDFAVGVDTIDIEQIDAILNLVDVDNAFTFIGAAAFTAGVSGQLRVQQVGTNTLIQGETNGIAGADFEILLTGNRLLTADDFIL